MNYLNNIFSFPCPNCEQAVSEQGDNLLCADCALLLREVKTPYCTGCGGELNGVLELCEKCIAEDRRLWKRAFSLWQYDGLCGRLIRKLKYNKKVEIARVFAEKAKKLFTSEHLSYDFVVPTPLHWTRLAIRGFNQSEIFAEAVSKECNVPLRKLLVRKRRTKVQAGLNRDARHLNTLGAFKAVKYDKIDKECNILLLDDVLTTGATLSSAVKALNSAGFYNVDVMVVARR